MSWKAKFIRNALFGIVPFPQRVRSLKRWWRPFPTTIPMWTLEEGFRQIELLREAGCDLHEKTVLEIGSGWQPIIPLLFSLAGAKQVILVDSQRLMDVCTFTGTVRNLQAHAILIAQRLGVQVDRVVSLLSLPSNGSLSLGLNRFRLKYLAPFDLIKDNLPLNLFDVVTSRAVFEHVPPETLSLMLARIFAILRPGGWTCHAIDNSDHWAHNDARISRLNFLRFSNRRFRLLCRFNPLDYQNRLRHHEYIELFKECGFRICVEKAEVDQQALASLESTPLDERFLNMSVEQLAKTDSYIVAMRATGAIDDSPYKPCSGGMA